jgi:hypothetical protein
MTSVQTKIIDLMTAHPTLSSAGIHFRSRDKYWHDPEYLKNCRDEMLSERFLNEVSLCEAFIARHGIKRGVTSYGLKHLVEDEHSNTYIHNGAFIIAAILRGYVPVLNPGPNPSFRKRPNPRSELVRGVSK